MNKKIFKYFAMGIVVSILCGLFYVRITLGMTLAHFASLHLINDTVAEWMIDLTSDIESKAAGGETPLYLAAYIARSPSRVELFLKKGADIEAKNGAGNTPLHIAVRDGKRIEIVEFLLDKGANIEAQASSITMAIFIPTTCPICSADTHLTAPQRKDGTPKGRAKINDIIGAVNQWF